MGLWDPFNLRVDGEVACVAAPHVLTFESITVLSMCHSYCLASVVPESVLECLVATGWDNKLEHKKKGSVLSR